MRLEKDKKRAEKVTDQDHIAELAVKCAQYFGGDLKEKELQGRYDYLDKIQNDILEANIKTQANITKIMNNLERARICEASDEYEDILLQNVVFEQTMLDGDEREALQIALKELKNKKDIKTELRDLSQKAIDQFK